MSKNYYRHYRSKKDPLKGGVTIVFRFLEDDRVEAAYSTCSRKDFFKKVDGRCIATARLNSQSKTAKKAIFDDIYFRDSKINSIFKFLSESLVSKKDQRLFTDRKNPMNMSMYEGVRFTNETFGKPQLKKDDPEFWAKLRTQHELIQEELDEIADAIVARDLKMLRDGVCDVEVTNLGMGHLVGMDVEGDMQKVLSSNLSKVSLTLERAQRTVAQYQAKEGITLEIVPCPTMTGMYVCISVESQTGKSGKTYPKGKFLKCVVGFREPAFT